MQKTETISLKNAKIKQNIASKIYKIGIYIFLILCAITVLFPFYWMIMSSFKTFADYSAELNPVFFPKHFTLQNYITAWTEVQLGVYMFNTVCYALVTTGLMLVVSVTAAFAFARLQFRGKTLVFSLYLATMMIPMELVTITNYVTIVNLNWRNTFTGLILPSVLSIFYIYLLRQNFMQVPDELYHASKVDGCSDFNYMTKILVPMSRPTLISIVILKIIECWNSFVWPRLITTRENYYLVSNGIQELRYAGFGRDNIPAMMAAVVIVSVPLLILFGIFRKSIMAGVSKSGLKG